MTDTTLEDAVASEDTVVASEEKGFERTQTIDLAKGNLNFFGGLCMPEIFVYLFPSIFLAIWNLLLEAVKQEKGKLQLAIGIPRGFAKTVFLKLYVIYVILFTNRNFIVIVCNTEQLAMNFLADVFDILSSHNLKYLFGDWKLGIIKDTQSVKEFGFRGRDIIVAGVGVGTSLRGISRKMRRPDVFIMDDMQSREEAEQPEVARKQLVWLMGTLMKARNYKRCVFIYVGNMYPFEGCILRKLKNSSRWISFVCGGILSDGKSLWEEMRPLKELLEELENDIELGHPEIFYSEVLNDEEAGSVSGVDVSKIPPYPAHLDTIEPQAGCIIIDPATKKQKQTNNTAIGAVLFYDGVPVLREVSEGIMTPLETIHNALNLAFKYGIKVICVESNAYQFTLLFWFDWVCKQINVEGIYLRELYAANLSKNAKIKAMLPDLLKTSQKEPSKYLHPEVRAKVIHQIVSWNPLKIHNIDDLLDILAWINKCVELYGNEMELQGIINLQLDSSPPAITNPAEMNLPF